MSERNLDPNAATDEDEDSPGSQDDDEDVRLNPKAGPSGTGARPPDGAGGSSTERRKSETGRRRRPQYADEEDGEDGSEAGNADSIFSDLLMDDGDAEDPVEDDDSNSNSNSNWGSEGESDGAINQRMKGRKEPIIVLSSDAESSAESEDEVVEAPTAAAEIPPEYWQVQRLVKYFKVSFAFQSRIIRENRTESF